MIQSLKKFKAIVKPNETINENEWRGKIRIQSTVHEGKEVNYTEAFKHIYKELGYKVK